METALLGYVFAFVAGVGGAGVVTAPGQYSRAGGAELPARDGEMPKVPPWKRPVVIGAILAIILWAMATAVLRETGLVSALWTGLAGGTAGATLDRLLSR